MNKYAVYIIIKLKSDIRSYASHALHKIASPLVITASLALYQYFRHIANCLLRGAPGTKRYSDT